MHDMQLICDYSTPPIIHLQRRELSKEGQEDIPETLNWVCGALNFYSTENGAKSQKLQYILS